jgi:galactokinase
MKPELHGPFLARHGRPPAVCAWAPGRIEFIGNHTDYNGGPVLGAAIDRGVGVAVAGRAEGGWTFASTARPGVVRVEPGDRTRRAGADAWVNYPLGVLRELELAGIPVPPAGDYLATSDLPEGAGLSSSAALEMASALAFACAAGPEPDRGRLVALCRAAENRFVGVPCGPLDQGVSGFGRRDHLVLVDARGPRFETVPLPAGVHLWLFNTPNRHALVDGLYAARHAECQAAARALGVTQLVEVTPEQLAEREGRLDPREARRAGHVVGEIARVHRTLAALRAGDLAEVGRLLTASHHSSRLLFENSTPELDFLVTALVAEPGVHGARLTGGGFGGAVLALTSAEFPRAAAERVAAAYAAAFGARPEVLHALTGDGAGLI